MKFHLINCHFIYEMCKLIDAKCKWNFHGNEHFEFNGKSKALLKRRKQKQWPVLMEKKHSGQKFVCISCLMQWVQFMRKLTKLPFCSSAHITHDVRDHLFLVRSFFRQHIQFVDAKQKWKKLNKLRPTIRVV